MSVQEYNFPDIIPSVAGFNIVSATEMDINELSGVEYITSGTYERWYIELTFNFLRKHEAAAIKAHLLKLRGSRNKSLIKDLGFTQTGSFSGTPRTNGANQYGMTIPFDGFTPNTRVAEPGDRVKLGQRVHEITDPIDSNGSGQASITFANEVINPLADNTALVTDPANLTIAARWLDPREIRQFQGNRSYFRNIRLTFIESLVF